MIARQSCTAESESLKVATETTNNSCSLGRPGSPLPTPPGTEAQLCQLTCDSRAASLSPRQGQGQFPCRSKQCLCQQPKCRPRPATPGTFSLCFFSRSRTANRHQWYSPGEKVNGSTIKEREKAFGKLWLTAQSQRKVDPIGFLFAFGWRTHGPITV